MTTEAQRAAMRRYYEKSKQEYRFYLIRLNKGKDADIIGILDAEPNKTDYIRRLVRGEQC